MNKAVVGVFADNISASRGINDLKAYGFGGDTINQVLRDDLMRGQRLPGPSIMPVMEILKGLIVGTVAGAILGAIADLLLGMSLSWPSLGISSPLYSAILTFAIVGAISGLLEGLAAIGPLAAAHRALLLRHRGDAVVTVHTDEAHAVHAADILRTAGATDVRRGASSLADEFRTVESVQPETYGATTVVQRDPVEMPAATGEVIETPPGSAPIG